MHRPFEPSPVLVEPGRELLGPGDWPRVFGREAPLVVEIGFGKDDGLMRRAKARPDHDFIGVELRRDRVATYLRRVEQERLANLRVVPGRAEVVLGVLLPPESVHRLIILFPDPWPKGRHWMHRLVRPYVAREMRRVLEPGGTVLLATDQAPYAEQMVAVMEGEGFAGGLLDPEEERKDADGTTIFERRWLARGRTVRYLEYRKR